jgi:transcriptional regulator with XRE-family HTH domain
MTDSKRLNKSVKKAKLTLEEVVQIKKLIISTDLDDGQLSDIYGVSRQQINRIRNGQRWGSLEDLMKDDIYIRITDNGVPYVLKFILENKDDYYIEELIIRGKKKS